MKLPQWTVEGTGDGYETPTVDCGTVDPSTVILRNYAYNSGFVCYISMNHSLNKTLGYWGLLD